MPDIPDVSPVLLQYCPKGGATLTVGPNRQRTKSAAEQHPYLKEMTDRICRVGDYLSATVHTLGAQQMINDPSITEPAFNQTHGGPGASIFTSRLSRN